jgi:hypothetical protein
LKKAVLAHELGHSIVKEEPGDIFLVEGRTSASIDFPNALSILKYRKNENMFENKLANNISMNFAGPINQWRYEKNKKHALAGSGLEKYAYDWSEDFRKKEKFSLEDSKYTDELKSHINIRDKNSLSDNIKIKNELSQRNWLFKLLPYKSKVKLYAEKTMQDLKDNDQALKVLHKNNLDKDVISGEEILKAKNAYQKRSEPSFWDKIILPESRTLLKHMFIY